MIESRRRYHSIVAAVLCGSAICVVGCRVPHHQYEKPVSDLSYGWFAGMHGDADRVSGAELQYELDKASFWELSPNRLLYGSGGAIGGFATPILLASGTAMGFSGFAVVILAAPAASAAGLVWGINAAMVADSMDRATIKREYLDSIAARLDPRIGVSDLVAFHERDIAPAAVIQHIDKFGTTTPTREEALHLVNLNCNTEIKYAFERSFRQDIAGYESATIR